MGAKNPVEKQGAIIHHLKMVIAFCRKPLAGSLMISAKVLCSNHPEEAILVHFWQVKQRIFRPEA